jgi:hypothetical protein
MWRGMRVCMRLWLSLFRFLLNASESVAVCDFDLNILCKDVCMYPTKHLRLNVLPMTFAPAP